MRKPRVYAAGPDGFSESGRLFHETVLIPLFHEVGFDVLDPWKLTPQTLIDSVLALPYGQKRKRRWKAVNKIIGGNNARAIKESDLIVAVLDGVDVDSGTASEIGYGAALGKFVFGYRSDFRLSSENEGCIVNIQVEYFILQSGGKVFTSIAALKAGLIKYRDDWYDA